MQCPTTLTKHDRTYADCTLDRILQITLESCWMAITYGSTPRRRRLKSEKANEMKKYFLGELIKYR